MWRIIDSLRTAEETWLYVLLGGMCLNILWELFFRQWFAFQRAMCCEKNEEILQDTLLSWTCAPFYYGLTAEETWLYVLLGGMCLNILWELFFRQWFGKRQQS
ncbi:uncharacterized protein LOC111871672 isoform X2 [Cryptotermes secundus]|uniref:uncharacterized protein LOC111871672 isoform X2 n=1 Tax=Cryptotermes secundus TaxID=105785 RepID=UPI001454D423|nr:uncharacterized protein LOC111871672 isoform X2 [Cryptotermes secundus]